jgi:hypothetical protein
VNAPTQLTPRLLDGRIDYHAEGSRILPTYMNPRLGWNQEVSGQANEEVIKEMNREYTIHTSLLRNHEGFKEETLNKYQDGYSRSPFTFINQHYEDKNSKEGLPLTGNDGASLMFDGKIVMGNLGKPVSDRQYITNSFRSVYEGYGSGGEPIFTTCYPSIKGFISSDTLDNIFYSSGNGLILSRFLSFPSYLQLKRGELPYDKLSKEDSTSLSPFPSMKYNYDLRLNQLLEKINPKEDDTDNCEGGGGGEGGSMMVGSGASSDRDKVNQMKRSLKELLKNQDEMISLSSVFSSEKNMISYYHHHSSTIMEQQEQQKKPPSSKQLLLSRSINSMMDEPPPAVVEVPIIDERLEKFKKMKIHGFWGGKWSSFTTSNTSKSNYYIPNATFPSSHLAIGAEFIFDSHQLNANMI